MTSNDRRRFKKNKCIFHKVSPLIMIDRLKGISQSEAVLHARRRKLNGCVFKRLRIHEVPGRRSRDSGIEVSLLGMASAQEASAHGDAGLSLADRPRQRIRGEIIENIYKMVEDRGMPRPDARSRPRIYL